MNNIIIIEGPDNIGKSFLARCLNRKYHGTMVHYGPNRTKSGGKKVFDGFIETLRTFKNKTFILDRSPFGEFVYGKLYRKYNPFTYWNHVIKSLQLLKNTRIFFIVIYADEITYEKFCIENKGDEEKLYQKKSQAEIISIKFIEVANDLGGIKNIERYVVNSNNYQSLDDRNDYITEAVDYFIKQQTRSILNVTDYSHTVFNPDQTQLSNALYTYPIDCKSYDICELSKQHKKNCIYGANKNKPFDIVGNIKYNKYIFINGSIGEGCSRYGIPFYGDASGNLFREALTQCGIIETECLIINLVRCYSNYDMTVEELLKLECVNRMHSEILAVSGKIIAVGNIADSVLKTLKIDCKKIYHPSYYLHKKKPFEFVEAMKEIV